MPPTPTAFLKQERKVARRILFANRGGGLRPLSHPFFFNKTGHCESALFPHFLANLIYFFDLMQELHSHTVSRCPN